MAETVASNDAALLAPPVRKRIIELDALRAISCLNLLLFHFTWVYQHKYGFESAPAMLFPYGKYGVQLFFMLSGFVNVMTLIGKRGVSDFIAARFIRIFPSYWLVIALNVLLFSWLPFFQQTPTVAETAANATTLPRLFGFDNMEPVTWTLQVEMLFYAFLAIITWRKGFGRLPQILLAVVTGCLLFSVASATIASAWPQSSVRSSLFLIEQLFIVRNFPLFAMGMLLNEIKSGRGNKWMHVASIIYFGIVFHAIDHRDHNPAATVMLFSLLAASAYGKVPVLRFKFFIFLSFISYPLYLFHNNIGSACMKSLMMLGCETHLAILIVFGLSIAMATALTKWFEQPITKRLRSWWKTRKENSSPAPARANSVSV